MAVASEAYARANGAEAEIKPPSPEEHDALMEKYG